MKVRVSIILFILSLTYSYTIAQQTNGGLVWETDIMKADAISKSSGKPIFAFFTGSDWCGWCHKLQNDVFSKQSFIDWAKKNVVLLELDFPRKKQLSPELQQQNNSLQQALKVQGFPTVWFLYMKKNKDSNSIELSTFGTLGYPKSEPGKEDITFLQDANEILKKKNSQN